MRDCLQQYSFFVKLHGDIICKVIYDRVNLILHINNIHEDLFFFQIMEKINHVQFLFEKSNPTR